MARAEKMEVTFDRASRDSIRSLVKAIDYLAATIKSDSEWGELAPEGDENVALLRRLVEDVKARPQVDQVFTERTAG